MGTGDGKETERVGTDNYFKAFIFRYILVMPNALKSFGGRAQSGSADGGGRCGDLSMRPYRPLISSRWLEKGTLIRTP
jgi:hypothetical protein